MKYKEFKKWCNERAADGMWDILTAMKCIEVMRVVDKFWFWKHLPKEMTQPVVVYGCPSVATGDPYIQLAYTSNVTISQEQLNKLNTIVNKDEQST